MIGYKKKERIKKIEMYTFIIRSKYDIYTSSYNRYRKYAKKI